VKDSVMEKVVYAKFTQHPQLRKILLSTGDAKLVEHTTNDRYWGDGGDGTGRNQLGITLMQVRDQIRKENKEEENIPASKKVAANNNVKKLKPQPFDYYCILDFEATCEENKKIYPQEIIEFPTILLNAKTLQIESEFHYYVKPTANPVLSPFCKELTGIQQDWVDKGILLQDAIEKYDTWLQEHQLFKNKEPIFAFVTCGDWDLKSCLTNQCKDQKIRKPIYFSKWVNIKKEFSNFYQSGFGDMVKMLNRMNIPLEGRHHSGIDDCKNITKIVQRMLQDGAILNTNGRLRND